MSGGFRWAIGVAALLVATAASAADPAKVLHFYFPTAETGFDPVRVSEIYSNAVNEVIFDRLLTYDYLARPAKIVPMAAEALPEVTDEGKTYTFHLRKGIYFADDPAFKGQKRELIAEDFAYSFKRFFDPANRSPYAFMLEGIVGLTDARERAEKSGKFDYEAKIAGLEVLDRYTLRIRLKSTDFNFHYKAAHSTYGAVAREVIERYADDTMGHPVGTGPYLLKEWTRNAKIVLEANPTYRGFTWDFASSEPDWDDALIKEMRGKKMPQIGRIEITILEEPQSRWLAFEGGQIDYINMPETFRDRALDADGNLLPSLAAKKVKHFRARDADITYTSFSFKDPVVGGFEKEKIALRRALIMSYDLAGEIKVVRKNLVVKDEMPIPFGVVGYDPRYRSINQYDPDLANKLLDHFGYKKGTDGYRTMPDGKPLEIVIATEPSSDSRQLDEVWARSLDAIHMRYRFNAQKFGENVKAAKACQLMMWSKGWIADFPDGENFMQLLYGPNTGESNDGCYRSKSFDALYEKSIKLPDSPERNRLYLEMTRQMEVDGAWRLGVSRIRTELIWPWVLGYKKHPILLAEWPYLDIAPRTQ
jgi:ABC-type transport system substrate-binding protein